MHAVSEGGIHFMCLIILPPADSYLLTHGKSLTHKLNPFYFKGFFVVGSFNHIFVLMNQKKSVLFSFRSFYNILTLTEYG